MYQGRRKRIATAGSVSLTMIILAALLVCISCDDEPSPAVLKGKVTACAGGSGIGGAQVDIVSASSGTAGLSMKTLYTDDDGNYWTKIGRREAPSIDAGNTLIYVKASAGGYASKQSGTFLIELDDTEEVNLCLDRTGSSQVE